MNEVTADSVLESAEEPKPASLGEIGLQRFAPYLMNRVMGRYNISLQDELAKSELTTAKMRTLAVLSTRNGLMVNELSVYCVIEQSTMSRTLAAMEEEGLVQRKDDRSDSRARRIYLTERGRETFDRLWPALSAAQESLFAGISHAEREAFLGTLQQMLLNIRKHPF